MNPKVLSASAIGLFAYAAEAMLAPPSERQTKPICSAISMFILLPFVHYTLDRIDPYKADPQVKKAIIDKSGRAVSEPEAVIKVQEYFQKQLRFSTYFAPLLIVGISLATHFAMITNGAYTAADIMFCYYARSKLEQQKWTLQSKPPEVKKEVKAAVGQMAAIPVINFSAHKLSAPRPVG